MRDSWNAWGDTPEPTPAPRDGTLSLLWLKLRRLAGTRPSTPTDDMEGQLRYERDGDVDGRLYLARRIAAGTYQWKEIATDGGSGTPTFEVWAAAGDAAVTTGSVGDDTSGTIILTPSGSGITTGTILRITFAVERPTANFSVNLTNASADARAMSLSAVISVGAKTTAKFDIATASALTTDLDYRLDYHVRQYG